MAAAHSKQAASTRPPSQYTYTYTGCPQQDINKQVLGCPPSRAKQTHAYEGRLQRDWQAAGAHMPVEPTNAPTGVLLKKQGA